MKNKGFTLIELLAVIVILAIIALIAVPVVLNIIGDSKQSSKQRSVEFYADALKQAMARQEFTNSVSDGKYTTTNGSSLVRNDESITAEYDGGSVVCDVIVINKGSVYLNKCKVNGEEIDYTYGYIKGDLDGDGLVTLEDLKIVKSINAGTLEYDKNADINGDGIINAYDANELQIILESKYDINNDGKVDDDDLTMINNILIAAESYSESADLDLDGTVTANDRKLLQKYLSYIQ